MSDDIVFDNFLISDDEDVANDFAVNSWDIKNVEERAASSAGVSDVLTLKLHTSGLKMAPRAADIRV